MHVPFRIRVLTWLALAAALCVAPATRAAEDPCLRHECSNDVVLALGDEPIVGDEAMRWEQVPGWDNRSCGQNPAVPCTPPGGARCFEVASWPDYKTIRRNCEQAYWTPQGWIYQGPSVWFQPYKVAREHFPRLGEDRRYIVRSCTGSACSDWRPETPQGSQDYVQFVGVEYECLDRQDDTVCESPCYPGAPTRNSRIADCP